MAFITEKVTEEEIEKYDLDERWNNYCNDAMILLPDDSFEHYWTIDREKKIWICRITNSRCVEGEVFLFSYLDKIIEIRIESTEDSEINREKSIDKTVYNLIYISQTNLEGLTEKEIKMLFKEALITHKSSFKSHHFNKIIVKCNW